MFEAKVLIFILCRDLHIHLYFSLISRGGHTLLGSSIYPHTKGAHIGYRVFKINEILIDLFLYGECEYVFILAVLLTLIPHPKQTNTNFIFHTFDSFTSKIQKSNFQIHLFN